MFQQQKLQDDKSQRRSAVKRKRSKAQGVGGKPTNVKTFAKKAGGLITNQRGSMRV